MKFSPEVNKERSSSDKERERTNLSKYVENPTSLSDTKREQIDMSQTRGRVTERLDVVKDRL